MVSDPQRQCIASAAPPRSGKRQYEIWPGNNRCSPNATRRRFDTAIPHSLCTCHRFCCHGFVMFGPPGDCEWNLCAWASIAVPLSGYFVYCSPILWEAVGPAIPLGIGYMAIVAVASLCLTSMTDPGYIPRQSQRAPAPDAGPRGRTRIFHTAQGESEFTWCPTCLLWRPPLSHHCSSCGHCVLGYDHHCAPALRVANLRRGSAAGAEPRRVAQARS